MIKYDDDDEGEEMKMKMKMKMKMMMKKEVEMKSREGEQRGRAERDREKQTQTLTPDTYALSRTTLEITIGCLCRGPSRRFQGACRFSTHKKLARRSDSLVGVSRRVERDRKKTRARELVITGGAQSGRLWRARTPSICE